VASAAGKGAALAGESCVARSACAVGLTCVSEVCQPMAGMSDGTSARYSGRGESCQAKNDCLPDLSCLMGVCRALDVSLTQMSKTCHRVECASKAECCQSFVANPNCPAYEANCNMDPIFCNTYRSLCLCALDCVEEQCASAAPGCKSAAECTSTQTPFCVEGKCQQCEKDGDCMASGAKCAEGVCTEACRQDENCPLLHACEDGVCVETGCKSDRECAFIMKNQLATCVEKECAVPCTSDAECLGDAATKGFETCEMGKCVFVGCESDTECRALFGLQNERTNVKALCK